jgi:hypothetical protein
MEEKMETMVKEVSWYTEMAQALQAYGIYFLLIFVFTWVVVQTSSKYSQSISTGNTNAQQMWKWINIAAWGVGGLLTILVACYWIYKDMKPLGYIYEISLAGTRPNTLVNSPQYYRLVTFRADPTVAEPGPQASLIADYKFLARVQTPFEAGHPFEFTIIQPPSPPSTQTVSFEKNDCKGSVCIANFKIENNELVRIARTGVQIRTNTLLAQATSSDSNGNGSTRR